MINENIEWKCLFCGKTRHEVRHLVASPTTEGSGICDECVGQSLMLLVAEGWIPPMIKLRVEIPEQEPETG